MPESAVTTSTGGLLPHCVPLVYKLLTSQLEMGSGTVAPVYLCQHAVLAVSRVGRDVIVCCIRTNPYVVHSNVQSCLTVGNIYICSWYSRGYLNHISFELLSRDICTVYVVSRAVIYVRSMLVALTCSSRLKGEEFRCTVK